MNFMPLYNCDAINWKIFMMPSILYQTNITLTNNKVKNK